MLYVGMARVKSRVTPVQNTQELPLTIDTPPQVGLTPLMFATMMGDSVLTNILLEGKHIDVNIQENVGCLLCARYTDHNIWDYNVQLYLFSRPEDGQLSTSLLRTETWRPRTLSSKQELMFTSKTRSEIVSILC